MTLRSPAIFLLLGCLQACSKSPHAPTDAVDALHLTRSVVGSSLLRPAVDAANAMASSLTTERLVVPVLGELAVEPNEVPVYLVEPSKICDRAFAFVPDGYRVVIVCADAFGKWLALRAYPIKEGFMSIDKSAFLSVMLLHELGHVVRGESAGATASLMDPGINRQDTEQKEKERAADEFAARAIREAAADLKDIQRFTTGNSAKIAIMNLSWNLFGIRILDHFGGTALNLPELFWDTGYSHPNLELRILTMNAHASPAPASQKMLDDFVQRRQQSDAIRPLYESK